MDSVDWMGAILPMKLFVLRLLAHTSCAYHAVIPAAFAGKLIVTLDLVSDVTYSYVLLSTVEHTLVFFILHRSQAFRILLWRPSIPKQRLA
jgi:hypothetical protein